ncbi:hypothetical protein GMSM_46090 [Geomonas sp. Red276]
MPRKNFYIADADVPVYEKAKEYIGESISGFIVDALKKLVHEKEDRGKELVEIRLWVGSKDDAWDISSGEYVKFTGRLLGTGRHDIFDDKVVDYELFETRKGSYLLYRIEEQHGSGTSIYSYNIYKEYLEVTKLNLPSKLLAEAEAKLKDFKCVELDI